MHFTRLMTQLAVWWHRRGEAIITLCLVLSLIGIGMPVLAGVLAPPVAAGLFAVPGGIALLMLALRILPQFLADTRIRAAVLAGIVILSLIGVTPRAPGDSTTEEDLLVHALIGSSRVYAQSDETLTFKAAPRITKQRFAAILQRGAGGGTSPAAPAADELYDIIVSYGLDPAVALAFFAHESQFCTTGVCQVYDTHGWGGQRAAVDPKRVVDVVRTSNGQFVRFGSWQDGLRDWCELILGYIRRGMDTVDKAVPVYAPDYDGNVPVAYINAIYRMVAAWQGRDPGIRASAITRTYADSLDIALVKETFLASELEYRATWAFHAYLLAEARAGRPLGAPLSESYKIIVDGRPYAVQVFALDTLYTPLSEPESETNWSDVRRLNDLIRRQPAPTATPRR